MSYINEALKKAQKDKDSRYHHYDSIITAESTRPVQKIRMGLFIVLLAILVLSISVYGVFYFDKRDNAGVEKTDGKAVSASPAETQETRVTPPNPAAQVPAATPEKTASSQAVAEKVPIPTPAKDKRLDHMTALYQEALDQHKKKNLARAERLYVRVIQINPKHVEALNNLGVIYMARKNRDRAFETLNRAIAVKRDYVDPYYNLACLFAQEKDIGGSLHFLKKAMNINHEVKNWALHDADLKDVVASQEFKKLSE
ncbi:MAG: tetratricopeptide repeat protein [Deltaproteobacteria bacterium]|nr:tetratricopeptide repeat protein [Deltaproteobacteria bacterium]